MWFQQPGVADAALGGDVRRTLTTSRQWTARLGRGGRTPCPETARLALRGGAAGLRRRLRAHRLHRRAQLVPQHRPQLGADRAVRRSPYRAARDVPDRRAGPRAQLHAGRGDGRLGHRPAQERDRAGRGPLGPAAGARGRQRRAARLPRGVFWGRRAARRAAGDPCRPYARSRALSELPAPLRARSHGSRRAFLHPAGRLTAPCATDRGDHHAGTQKARRRRRRRDMCPGGRRRGHQPERGELVVRANRAPKPAQDRVEPPGLPAAGTPATAGRAARCTPSRSC